MFLCSNVDDKPGSASSRKEKGGDGFKSPDLVEVKTGAYTKKCVLPTVFLSIVLSGLAGAGIFFLAYYFTVEFCEYSHQLSTLPFSNISAQLTAPGTRCPLVAISSSKTLKTGPRLKGCASYAVVAWQSWKVKFVMELSSIAL